MDGSESENGNGSESCEGRWSGRGLLLLRENAHDLTIDRDGGRKGKLNLPNEGFTFTVL